MIEFAQGDGPDMRTLTFSSAGRRWTSILSDLRSEIMGERA
jgi:hypothetical protein